MRITVGYWQYPEHVLGDEMEIWGVTCPAHREAIENEYWRRVDEDLGGRVRRALAALLRRWDMTDVEIAVGSDPRVAGNLFLVEPEPADGWPAGGEDEVESVVAAAYDEWSHHQSWDLDDERIDREHELACGACREGRCGSGMVQAEL